MNTLINIHADKMMELLITSGQNTIEMNFKGVWIKIQYCMRNGQRSGGINIESGYKVVHTNFHKSRDFLDIRYFSKFKTRLKKGWKSAQLRAIFAKAYQACPINIRSNDSLCICKENPGHIYYVHFMFHTGKVRARNIATNKMVDLQRNDLEVLTVTPEEWYNRRGMKNSLLRYKKFQSLMTETRERYDDVR